MNIEEKAKAYDEALEKAKVHINSKGIGDTVDLCRHLFPELRESEDERIRKWLVALVENLGEPADEDAEKELEEMRPLALAYLEKQKENPKSADSIPSNCTSNAKYEDIWHKVSDSLPDNTREVLCKDAIGNYFIGRYYSKGIWEISMYDDCDKSNEDNPPVVMWIDIPSEKQKEESLRDYIDNFPYSDQKEQKPIFRVGDNIIAKGGTCIPKEPFHIERIENDCYWNGNNSILICNQDDFQLVDQNPIEWGYDNRVQYASVESGIKAFASTYSFNIESKLFPQLTNKQQQLWREEIEQAVIAGGEDGIELTRDNRYKENRTIEWSDEDKSFYDSIMCEVVKEGMHLTPEQVKWFKSLPERFNLQPKQEWSEEDEKMCQNVLECLRNGWRKLPTDVLKYESWLRSFCPQLQ